MAQSGDFVRVSPDGRTFTRGGAPFHFCGANCYYMLVKFDNHDCHLHEEAYYPYTWCMPDESLFQIARTRAFDARRPVYEESYITMSHSCIVDDVRVGLLMASLHVPALRVDSDADACMHMQGRPEAQR